MNIIQIYKRFPTQQSCIDHLEKVRWNNEPVCPYCKSKNQTKRKGTNRYHCNNCNTSYSVMVGTIFHNTKLDFQKWFLAISLVLNAKKGLSARQLSRDIEVTKDTAWYMLMRIRKAMVEYGNLLQGIVEADETYIGGKNKNKHSNKKTKGGQGRNTQDKDAVFGLIERGGKVIAQKVNKVDSRTLKTIINRSVQKGSKISTDEWMSYKGLDGKFEHLIVKHGAGIYVDGLAHTNTMECFWSLLKRGIIGQFHNVSSKYLNKYINEFCYRFNNRDNDQIFELTLQRSLNI